MQITKIKMRNWKGETGEQVIKGTNLFIGKNGAGKTARHTAVIVAILGFDPAISNTPRDVMQHIAGDEGGVAIMVKNGKEVTEISRDYKRNEKGEIKLTTRVVPKKNERNASEYNARIRNEFGQFSIMFNLLEFYNMTETEMRNFFFDKCKSTGFDKEKVFKILNETLVGKTGELRKEMKLLIDAYDKAWDDELTIKDNVGKLLDDLKQKHNNARSKLNSFLDVEDEVNDKKTEDDTGQRIKTLRGQIERHETEIKKAQTTIDKEDANRTAYNNKSEEVSEVAGRVANLKEMFSDSPDYIKVIASAEDKIKEIRTVIDKSSANLEIYNETMDEIGAAKARIKKEESDIDVNADYEKIEILRDAKMKKLMSEEAELTISFNEAEGVCPIGKGCPEWLNHKKDNHDTKEKLRINKENTNALAELINENLDNKSILKYYKEDKNKLAELEERLKKYGVPQNLEKLKNELTVRENEMGELRCCQEGKDKHADAVERLATLKDQLSKHEAPSDVSALKDIVLAHEQNLKEVRENLETKLKAQEAERLLADVKLERTKYEVVLDAVKVLGEVAGKNGIYGDIIKSILDPFAKVVNGLLQEIDAEKYLSFELEDKDTGKACFRFGWKTSFDSLEYGFIPFNALSSGEQALFSVAIMVALIKQNDPPLKTLMIDNIEAIDDDNRADLINACCKFKDAGEVDNVMLSGCMQNNMVIDEGVSVWRL